MVADDDLLSGVEVGLAGAPVVGVPYEVGATVGAGRFNNEGPRTDCRRVRLQVLELVQRLFCEHEELVARQRGQQDGVRDACGDADMGVVHSFDLVDGGEVALVDKQRVVGARAVEAEGDVLRGHHAPVHRRLVVELDTFVDREDEGEVVGLFRHGRGQVGFRQLDVVLEAQKAVVGGRDDLRRTGNRVLVHVEVWRTLPSPPIVAADLGRGAIGCLRWVRSSVAIAVAGGWLRIVVVVPAATGECHGCRADTDGASAGEKAAPADAGRAPSSPVVVHSVSHVSPQNAPTMGRERKSKRVLNCQQQTNYVPSIDAAYTSHDTADTQSCETWMVWSDRSGERGPGPKSRSPKLQNSNPDVVVVGGGPAGSSTATFLAKAGWKVTLLEREQFPRDHVGESLLPGSLPVLEQLGVLPEVEAAGFLK